MRVLSLFDGISCGRVALERAGISVDRYVSYEIDKHAIAISSKNYPHIEQRGDVTCADFSEFKDFDLLIGGSPCTYWSIAKGKGRETTCEGMGFDLFMQFVRARQESGGIPYFLYENNHSISAAIKNEISNRLGVSYIMINSALVSAQSRKRCYWTNIPLTDYPQDKGVTLQSILENGWADREKSHCICRRYSGFTGSQSYLCRRYFEKGLGQAKFADELSYDIVRGRYAMDNRFESTQVEIQPLTVTEVERLQTLPDGYTECDGISVRQRIEAIGNGWTVDVIAHILSGLKDYNMLR